MLSQMADIERARLYGITINQILKLALMSFYRVSEIRPHSVKNYGL